MEKEKQLLTRCRTLIEQSLNWGDSSTWGNDDFEHLSEKIFDRTKVQLSISTLKRIWGKVRYENFPTTATLNALAGFLGYTNWRDFKQKNTIGEPSPIRNDSDASRFENAAQQGRGRQIESAYTWPLIVVIVITAVVGLAYFKKRLTDVDLSKIKFEAKKVSD